MKLEVEIDAERIHREVVQSVTAWAYSEVKDEVQRLVKATIVTQLKEQAKVHAAEILKEYVLPDGRTFKQYVEDLILKPSGPFNERPKLLAMAADTVSSYCKQWWQEIFIDHMPAMKESLRKQLLDTTLDTFIQVKK